MDDDRKRRQDQNPYHSVDTCFGYCPGDRPKSNIEVETNQRHDDCEDDPPAPTIKPGQKGDRDQVADGELNKWACEIISDEKQDRECKAVEQDERALDWQAIYFHGTIPLS